MAVAMLLMVPLVPAVIEETVLFKLAMPAVSVVVRRPSAGIEASLPSSPPKLPTPMAGSGSGGATWPYRSIRASAAVFSLNRSEADMQLVLLQTRSSMVTVSAQEGFGGGMSLRLTMQVLLSPTARLTVPSPLHWNPQGEAR